MIMKLSFHMGVEPINHHIMMVNTSYENERNNTRINMSEIWTNDSTMAKKLVRDDLDDKSDFSGDEIYHLVDIIDD